MPFNVCREPKLMGILLHLLNSFRICETNDGDDGTSVRSDASKSVKTLVTFATGLSNAVLPYFPYIYVCIIVPITLFV